MLCDNREDSSLELEAYQVSSRHDTCLKTNPPECALQNNDTVQSSN